MQRAMPYCLEHALPNNLCVFRSRVAVRPIHATTHRHHATPRSRLDATVYHTRVTCHSAIQDTIVRDRPTLDDMRTTAPLPVPPQPFSLMPRRRTTRMSGGPRPTPPRRHHNAAAASRAAVRRRRIARAIPWVHARSSPPAGSSPLAHPPLHTPSAAGSHTATPPRRHAATPPPCDQGQARRQYVSM